MRRVRSSGKENDNMQPCVFLGGGGGNTLQGKRTSVSPSRDPLDKYIVEQADVLLLGTNTLAKVKLNRIIAFLIRSHVTPASFLLRQLTLIYGLSYQKLNHHSFQGFFWFVLRRYFGENATCFSIE